MEDQTKQPADRPMTSDDIWAALKEKHSGSEWALFGELRSHTGYSGSTGYMDAYAVGLWKHNPVCIAYEIKVTRHDFKSDIEQFLVKQKAALRNSHQFSYVVPQGLVDPSEVPELAGLIYVTKGGLRTKKVAPLREMPGGVPEMDFIRSLMRATIEMAEIRNKKLMDDVVAARGNAAFSAKYGGRDLTEKDIDALASERAVRMDQDQIEIRVRHKVAEKRLRSYEALKKVAKAAGCGEMWQREIYDENNLKALCDIVDIAARIRHGQHNMRANCQELMKNADSLKYNIGYVLSGIEGLSLEPNPDKGIPAGIGEK